MTRIKNKVIKTPPHNRLSFARFVYANQDGYADISRLTLFG